MWGGGLAPLPVLLEVPLAAFLALPGLPGVPGLLVDEAD